MLPPPDRSRRCERSPTRAGGATPHTQISAALAPCSSRPRPSSVLAATVETAAVRRRGCSSASSEPRSSSVHSAPDIQAGALRLRFPPSSASCFAAPSRLPSRCLLSTMPTTRRTAPVGALPAGSTACTVAHLTGAPESTSSGGSEVAYGSAGGRTGCGADPARPSPPSAAASPPRWPAPLLLSRSSHRRSSPRCAPEKGGEALRRAPSPCPPPPLARGSSPRRPPSASRRARSLSPRGGRPCCAAGLPSESAAACGRHGGAGSARDEQGWLGGSGGTASGAPVAGAAPPAARCPAPGRAPPRRCCA